MIRCSFDSWSLASGMEPTIRIGVVLPEDGMNTLQMRVPSSPHILAGESGPEETIQGVSLRVTVEGESVRWESGDRSGNGGSMLRLSPREETEAVRGSGVLLRGVISGRGFHWQKHMQQTLCGELEFRAWEGRLLVVNELPMEDYLPGVISGEMSGDCPLEFLRSQCIVARSWVLARTEAKHVELPIDRCNDDDCQRYHGTSDLTPTALEAVRSTRGVVLLDKTGQLIDANYSKSCGGIIESPEHVWRVSKPGQRAAVDAPAGSTAGRFFPMVDERMAEYVTGDWLTGTDIYCSPNVVREEDLPRYLSKVDEGGHYFRWRLRYDREDLEQVLTDKFFSRHDPGKLAPLGTLMDLRVLGRGASGRATAVEVKYTDPMERDQQVRIDGEFAIRDALHEKFLYSSAFVVESERDAHGVPTRFILRGAGWGHGAGLCQIGALGMALKGIDAPTILKHYFDTNRIEAVY
jgi:peptidoglycan hydrolase-like amidase